MEKSVLVEIEWDFGDIEDPNWMYCNEEATFSHREACEFILHIGQEVPGAVDTGEDAHWRFIVDNMKKAGCTPDFIQAYLDAKDAGAMRVMFWS